MLAYSAEKAFNDPEWLFEIKWDGYRAIAEINKKEILLYSRNNISFVSKYPLIAEALKKIKHDAIFDGEIVALDENNKPNFQLLQNYEKDSSLPLLYYVFDCLNIDGKDIKDIPLIQRKKLLKKIILPKSIIKYCDHVMEKGKDFFSAIIQNDLEGMMAKKKDSLYSPGVRTNQWLKIKHHHVQEAVIAGFTEPRNSRKYFGALILGIYEKKRLHYVGHTGTGFTEQTLKDLHQKMQPHIRLTSPFSEKIKTNAPVTWVDPVLVCNIKFTEKTKSDQLRHPVFMGLRIDKAAKETTMEETNAVNTKKQKTQKKESEVITVGDHQLTLTHGDKLYWPKDKITKADMINYYSSMSKYILPYLKGRPQSLKRNPNGIIDEGFYHKDAGDIAPKWINTVKLYSDSADKKINYIICDDEATLFFLNNLGCIEINPWNSTVKHLDEPDYLVMDIDPSEKNAFDDVVDVALVLKEIFDKAAAKSYCKTSGATGLHVYVPFHAAYDYEQVRSFANAIALMTQEKLPATTTMERSLNKRNGKIYLDYLQNKKGQTLASVYSLRPRPGAPVSTPLLWKEVRHGLDPHAFNIHTIKRRVEKKGDLFAGILTEKTNLRQCLKKLNF